MNVLAELYRLIGVDTLHIGTVVGKLEGSLKEISEIEEEIEKKAVKETNDRLSQDWGRIKPTLAVSSGGLHPGHVPFLMKHLGKDIVMQFGGGIHGHLNGTVAGARAVREAVDAVLEGKTLKEYSKDHFELKQALKQWEK